MRTSTRMLLAATAMIIAGAGAGYAADPTDAVRSANEITSRTLDNQVAVIVGVGESYEIVYVDSNSAAAPVTAFAGAPVSARRGRAIYVTEGVPVLIGAGESAEQVYVPASQAPRTAFGGRG